MWDEGMKEMDKLQWNSFYFIVVLEFNVVLKFYFILVLEFKCWDLWFKKNTQISSFQKIVIFWLTFKIMIGLKLMWKWKNLSILFMKSLYDENWGAKLRREVTALWNT